MKLIPFLLLFSFSLTSQQLSWERHRSIVPQLLFSFDADSAGNYFYTLDNSQVVVHGNVFSKEEIVYSRIKNIRFNPNKHHVEVFIDKGQEPIIEHSNSIYQFGGKQFYLDTIRKPYWNFSQLKYDENFVLYKTDYKYIRRCENGLYSNVSYPLAEFSDWIQKSYLFNTDSNFLVIGEYNSGIAEIVQLNTETGQYKVLVNIKAPMPKIDHSILFKDGRFIIPTEREIFYYRDYGKHFEAPLIDTAEQSRGLITALSAGKIKGEIVVRKGSKFYFSYDGLKTWVLSESMNKGFPLGQVTNLVLWDSLHAVAVVADDCGHRRLYVFKDVLRGWEEAHHPDFDNSSFLDLYIDENQRMIGNVFTCGWMFKDQQDSIWIPIYSPGPINNDYEGYLTNYLMTDRKDLAYNFKTLYSTDDYGSTWDSIWTFSEGITGMNYFGNGVVLVSTGYNGSTFFISKDFGQSFNFAAAAPYRDFPIHGFKLDHRGLIVAINRNGINSNSYYLDEKSKSWKIDTRFSNLMCRSFEFAIDGKYFLDIEYGGLRGIYSTYDFVNFYNITQKLGYTYAYTFKYLGNRELVLACNNYDGVRGVYYSKDDGESLIDLTWNLPFMRDNIQYGSVEGFLSDKDRQLYLWMRENGIFKLSNPLDLVGIKDLAESSDSIELFPQPVTNDLWFSFRRQIEDFQCRIFDMVGQQIVNPTIINNHIDVSQLTPGIYYLQFCEKSGKCWTVRFIKIH